MKAGQQMESRPYWGMASALTAVPALLTNKEQQRNLSDELRDH